MMLYRNLIFTGVFAAVLATSTTAQAFDDAKYPDLSGQWVAVRMPGVTGQPAFDPTKPWGRGQQAPLTPEYQKVLNCGSGDRRSGQLAHRRRMPAARHAGDDDALSANGDRRVAGDDLHSGRPYH